MVVEIGGVVAVLAGGGRRRRFGLRSGWPVVGGGRWDWTGRGAVGWMTGQARTGQDRAGQDRTGQGIISVMEESMEGLKGTDKAGAGRSVYLYLLIAHAGAGGCWGGWYWRWLLTTLLMGTARWDLAGGGGMMK